ncbi:LCHN-like protein [Fusarium agapanthi]|uniref:LCHN-like protein n=1 Tax=Fusarium agapanthi TaxID=1803897 RepID=A0A9P5BKM4_9HYPO|nr:LCHN-like protein [Fusarium agapanthi]
MASSRRGQPSLSVRMPSNQPLDRPPIDALFLIHFDVKAGYTILWKQNAPGIDLEGLVEYKSLPSGLHTVSEDLIYFVHDNAHAGLSAFVNMPCDEEEARNARMFAVGVLVPLSYGRLGRAWRHAEGLKEMAAKLAEDRKNTSILEEYWVANREKSGNGNRRLSGETPVSSPSLNSSPFPRKTHSRNRSASDGASLIPPGNKLSPYHPAWSLTSLLDKLGPLIFPIHRAALLRKRILISCHAPVHEVCDFVYNLSVLSNIPLSVTDILPGSASTQRLRPLFSIGVHDIPFLMDDFEASKRPRNDEDAIDDESGSGWIACTTDSILAMKDTLWDMLVTLPPDYSSNAIERVWPVVECPRGQSIKATQRDLRRFTTLKNGLARLAAASQVPSAVPESPEEERAAHRFSTQSSHIVRDPRDDSVEKVVEPLTWAAFAYNGYMWWASAGEQLRQEQQEEAAHDASLLADFGPSMTTPRPGSRSGQLSDSLGSLNASNRAPDGSGEARFELAIIAYFHRLTTQILSVLADLADSQDEPYTDHDDDDEDLSQASGERAPLRPSDSDLEPDDADAIRVDSHAVESMGLDVWSDTDALFIRELSILYFGRPARIEGKGVEVCGVRLC